MSDDNIIPKTSAQDALHELCNYLLGKDWYIVDPVSQGQANTIIVQEIKKKYKKRYRRKKKK